MIISYQQKTQAEWDAFAANLPPGVSIGSCCISHDPQACYDNDVYWYEVVIIEKKKPKSVERLDAVEGVVLQQEHGLLIV